MSITWLASYPKSGNTWVRTFLTNYIEDKDEPADINDLRGGWSYLERSNFDDIMGLSSSDMTDQELNHYRPLYHSALVEHAEPPVFIKTHEAYRLFDSGASLFAPVDGCKAVHLVRNPLDVTVSFAHHNDKTIDKTIRKMANPKAKMSGGAFRFIEFMNDWSAYNESWMTQVELPVLRLRYEDMLADSEAAFAEIVRFAGLEFDLDRVKKAVSFSSFKTLQDQERKAGFQERQPTAESFFRKGVAGDWQEKLTTAQVEKTLSKHHRIMELLGYNPDEISRSIESRTKIAVEQ